MSGSRETGKELEEFPINGEVPHSSVNFAALTGSPDILEKIDKGILKKICDIGLPASPNYGVVVKIAIAAAVIGGTIAAAKGVERIRKSRQHKPIRLK